MDERIIETERARETPVHTTTVIRERGSSGATGIIMALALLIAVVGGMYFFSRQNASETARNDAVAQAASDIGKAADKVGDAAQNAANTLNNKDK